MRISDWSSDVCSSDLSSFRPAAPPSADLSAALAVVAEGAVALSDRFAPAHLLGAGDEVEALLGVAGDAEIGSASCRERGCQYVYNSVVRVSLKNNITDDTDIIYYYDRKL